MRFRSGVFFTFSRLLFRLYSLKYFLQPHRYPLSAVHSRNGGVLRWLKAGNVLGLTRQAVFRGKAFLAPLVPAFPSAAFDRMVANGGMNVSAAGTPWKRQIDLAILAVTRRCPLVSEHGLYWGDIDNDGDVDFAIEGSIDTLTVKPLSKVYVNNSKKVDIPHWHAVSTSKRCISEENAVYLQVNAAGVIQW